jgi:hypothetical protein
LPDGGAPVKGGARTGPEAPKRRRPGSGGSRTRAEEGQELPSGGHWHFLASPRRSTLREGRSTFFMRMWLPKQLLVSSSSRMPLSGSAMLSMT